MNLPKNLPNDTLRLRRRSVFLPYPPSSSTYTYTKRYPLSARLVHVRDVYLTPSPPASVPTHVEFSGRKAIAVADPILSVDRVSCPSLCVLVQYNNRVAGRDGGAATIRSGASLVRSFREDPRFRPSADSFPREDRRIIATTRTCRE